jgi:hypothetical protein
MLYVSLLFSKFVGLPYIDIITIDESGFNLNNGISKFGYDLCGTGNIRISNPSKG